MSKTAEWSVFDAVSQHQAADHDLQHSFVICDVFTSEPLAGNQLAVFLDGRPLKGEQMQRIARETNFAETVFVLPPASDGDVRVRIFTPCTEMPFAGHPVLGTAFVVASISDREIVRLETGLGTVSIELERHGNAFRSGLMKQPIPVRSTYDHTGRLLAALGDVRAVLPVETYDNGPKHVLVALQDEDAVADLVPDMGALADLNVPVSCFAGNGSTWKTRMFYPGGGVPEDPATGSAAGPIALHLALHGVIDFGQTIDIRQGAEIGRPAQIKATVDGLGDDVTSITVGGCAVLVASGHFRAPTITTAGTEHG